MKKIKLEWDKKRKDYVKAAIIDLEGLVHKADQGGVSVGNPKKFELIVEALTGSIKYPKYLSYDDIRQSVAKGIYTFIHYQMKNSSTLKKAIIVEINSRISSIKKKHLTALFLTPAKIYRKLKLSNKISLLGETLIFESWSKLKQDFDVARLMTEISWMDSEYNTQILENDYIPTLLSFRENERLLNSNIENHFVPFTLYRSIINYSINNNHFTVSGSSRVPYNEFLPNEYVGLFQSDGNYLSIFSSFAKYKNVIQRVYSNNDMDTAILFFKKFAVKNDDESLDSLLSKILVTYTGALDKLDYGTIFFGLWRVLETIIYPVGKPNYKYLPKRVGFILNQSIHIENAMEAIINIRQKYFHKEAYLPSEYSQTIHLMRKICESLIMWLYDNPLNLKSEKELRKYLDRR